VEQITLNGPRASDRNQSVLYVTERAIFSLVEEGIKLIEIAPGCDVKKDVLDHMEFSPIIPTRVKTMEKKIFQPLNLAIKRTWDRELSQKNIETS
jgi:propionate CoA-transferase